MSTVEARVDTVGTRVELSTVPLSCGVNNNPSLNTESKHKRFNI